MASKTATTCLNLAYAGVDLTFQISRDVDFKILKWLQYLLCADQEKKNTNFLKLTFLGMEICLFAVYERHFGDGALSVALV